VTIEPFSSTQLNPNSYNFHLEKNVIEFNAASDGTVEHVIGPQGYLFLPGRLYLGCTAEVIGSEHYVMTLLGRSSIGRLGLFVNITADLGHRGAVSQWTLEMTVVQPLRIYAGMPIGQVAFWIQHGQSSAYSGRYHRDHGPQQSKDRPLSAKVRHDPSR
jgi:dCTP deaminase